ncbi:MAG: sulfurtransferase TusA family protein [Acetivibrio sp.]
MNTIDARGYSCPQPVLMAKKAFASKENEYTIFVDTNAAKENVTRFATHSGFQVSCKETEGEYYTLTISR